MSSQPASQTFSCVACHTTRPRGDYSTKQWKKRPLSRCKTCVNPLQTQTQTLTTTATVVALSSPSSLSPLSITSSETQVVPIEVSSRRVLQFEQDEKPTSNVHVFTSTKKATTEVRTLTDEVVTASSLPTLLDNHSISSSDDATASLHGSDSEPEDVDDEVPPQPSSSIKEELVAPPSPTPQPIIEDSKSITADVADNVAATSSSSFFGSMLRGVLQFIVPSYFCNSISPPSPPPPSVGSKRSLEASECSFDDENDSKRAKFQISTTIDV